MRHRKVGSGSARDPMHGAASGATGKSVGPYFGTGGRGHGTDQRPQAGPAPAESPSRLRKVSGGNTHRFASGAGPTAGANTIYHGHPSGGPTAATTPRFDVPMGSHKRHRKIHGNSGVPDSPGRSYVGPGGMNGSSGR